MRLRPLQSLLLACLLLLLLAPQLACTAIGALIGSGVDEAIHQPRVIPAGEAVTIPPGKAIVLLLRTGRRVTGAYRDTTTLSDTAYAALWSRWQDDPSHVESVRPGEEVTVVDSSGEWRGRFVGYHYRSIVVEPLEGGPAKRVRLSGVRTLRGPNGREWNGESIAALDASGALPSQLALVVQTGESGHGITQMTAGRKVVPTSEVVWLTLEGSHVGRNVGALVGLAGDVLLVANGTVAASSRGCIFIFPKYSATGGQVEALASGIHLTTQSYDRLAGAFVPSSAGGATPGRHAAAVR